MALGQLQDKNATPSEKISNNSKMLATDQTHFQLLSIHIEYKENIKLETNVAILCSFW